MHYYSNSYSNRYAGLAHGANNTGMVPWPGAPAADPVSGGGDAHMVAALLFQPAHNDVMMTSHPVSCCVLGFGCPPAMAGKSEFKWLAPKSDSSALHCLPDETPAFRPRTVKG